MVVAIGVALADKPPARNAGFGGFHGGRDDSSEGGFFVSLKFVNCIVYSSRNELGCLLFMEYY